MPYVPFKRRRVHASEAYGVPTSRRKQRVYMVAQKKAWRQEVRDVINDTSETKRKAADITPTSITTTVITHELTDIDQGDGVAQRDGHQIYTRSYAGRFVVQQGASATGCQYVRFVLYTPKNIDSLETTMTYVDRIDPDDFIIYWDKLVKVDDNNPCKIVKLGKKWWSKKIPGLLTQYSSSTAGDLIRKNVCLAIVSSTDTNPPTYSGYHTLFFKDK